MILLVAAEKGGVGKSTIATNLAAHLASQSIDLVMVDADIQATCTNWVARRDELKRSPAVPCVQRSGEVASTLRELDRRYAVVIVDAGGRDSREMRTAMAVANLLIIPTQASQADLETFPKMNELVALARGLNPDLNASAVLSRAPSNPVIREVEEARELLTQFEQLQLADTVIRDRKVYRDALLAGKGVTELDNSQARAEIQLLAQEFFDLN
ncbi:AAA family ATPase [Paraburkholderia sp. MM5477-R1]|uniref:AAA family ATPase n=1 Tax=Paraburkholderia sp. MM5477-R1 TaxID=2991062 RepID=UPI003D193C12